MAGVSLERTPGAGLLIDGNEVVRDVNERCRVVFKCDVDEIVDRTLETLADRGFFDRESHAALREAVASVIDREADERQVRITVTPPEASDPYPYRVRVTPADTGRRVVRCALRSVGTTQRYEETVTALHHATRDLMEADSREAVLGRTVRAAADVLGFPGTGVRLHDETAGLLRHVAFGSTVTSIDTRPPYPVDDSPHGQALQTGETVIDDIGEDDPYDREVFSQTMYVPIGDVGVLSVGTVGDTFDELDVQFAEILAENAVAAVNVVETAASLRRERERLRQLKEVRSRVLRHDMRNALTALLNESQYLAELTDGEAAAIARSLYETAEEMAGTVEQARRIESVIRERDAEVSVTLSAVVDAATDREAVDPAPVETVVRRDGTFPAHPMFHVAVAELVENAVVHGDDPAVTVWGTVDDEAVVEVRDDGPGIPPAELAVFEERQETPLQHSDGTGLWLVDWIVRASGGEWTCQTGDDGTTVRVTVPR